MQIEWINHASYIIRYKDVSFLCDPWIEGRVFNLSWEHLVKTKFEYYDFKTITHIWFSHEHPDHFFPPNIKNIPEEARQNITILFHESIDRKVVEFCKRLNFKNVIEIKDWQTTRISDEISIVCSRVENDTDSWLFMNVVGTTILNLNDCVFSSNAILEKIKSKLPSIDLLLTQFSYASWCGNLDQKKLREQLAAKKVEEVKYRINLFKPRKFIPFASYVWFCHEDNFFMNDSINKIGTLYYDLKLTFPTISFVVPKPGDIIELENFDQWDSSKAINLYNDSYNSLEMHTKSVAQIISKEVLEKAAKMYYRKSLTFHNSNRLKQFNPMIIGVKDYKVVYSFDFNKGLMELDSDISKADIILTSDVLKFTFEMNWGFDTLLVSGLFQKPIGGNFENVKNYIFLGELLNKGEPFGNKIAVIKRRIRNWIKFKF